MERFTTQQFVKITKFYFQNRRLNLSTLFQWQTWHGPRVFENPSTRRSEKSKLDVNRQCQSYLKLKSPMLTSQLRSTWIRFNFISVRLTCKKLPHFLFIKAENFSKKQWHLTIRSLYTFNKPTTYFTKKNLTIWPFPAAYIFPELLHNFTPATPSKAN